MQDIYQKVFERLLKEFSTMSGGAVGGVSTPLGTGPKAGSRGEKIYKKSTATDKKHRSKGKKKKTYTRSVQYYLKHGGEKSRKRTFKESYSFLFEAARSARIPDLKKSEIIAYLNFLKGEVSDEIQFSVTEKIAGQAMNVGIRGTSSGNMVYCSTKQGFENKSGDFFAHSNTRKGSATSKLVRQAFIESFRKLAQGEEIKLSIEVIKSDSKKPDFISYGVPEGSEKIAVFGIDPPGSFTRKDADTLTGYYKRSQHGEGGNLTVLLPEDIPLQPDISQKTDVFEEIDALILDVQNSPKGRGSDPDQPNKTYIRKHIAPRIRRLISLVFPASNLNVNSPIEAAAVNMTRDGKQTFFKVPNEDFNALQRAQSSVYAEFRTNEIRGRRRMGNKKYYALLNKLTNKRIDSFIDQIGNPVSQTFAYNVFKYIKFINEINILKMNFVTFFSPEQLDSFCNLMLEGLQNKDRRKIKKAISLFGVDGKNNYSSTGQEEFRSVNTEALAQFIDQNNLI
tara:strand:+ start:227 stop:1750 length:1524 start_codon:yes stop_codon:yes gene_type:complete